MMWRLIYLPTYVRNGFRPPMPTAFLGESEGRVGFSKDEKCFNHMARTAIAGFVCLHRIPAPSQLRARLKHVNLERKTGTASPSSIKEWLSASTLGPLGNSLQSFSVFIHRIRIHALLVKVIL
jgi:hypothetical protein